MLRLRGVAEAVASAPDCEPHPLPAPVPPLNHIRALFLLQGEFGAAVTAFWTAHQDEGREGYSAHEGGTDTTRFPASTAAANTPKRIRVSKIDGAKARKCVSMRARPLWTHNVAQKAINGIYTCMIPPRQTS